MDDRPMQFESRIDAARRLAQALASYKGRNPLVLAIPRGAVEMGRVLAGELEGELDVVLVRQLPSPHTAALPPRPPPPPARPRPPPAPRGGRGGGHKGSPGESGARNTPPRGRRSTRRVGS